MSCYVVFFFYRRFSRMLNNGSTQCQFFWNDKTGLSASHLKMKNRSPITMQMKVCAAFRPPFFISAFSVSTFSFRGDELLHRHHRRLRRENFLDQHAMDFFIAVKTRVLEHDTVVIQIERAPQRREHDAARRDAEEHQIPDAPRAQDQA